MTDRYQPLRDALFIAEKTGESWPLNSMAKEIGELLAEYDALRRVATAADKLSFEAQEYDFDDGLGQGAPQSFWDDLSEALDEFDQDATLADGEGQA